MRKSGDKLGYVFFEVAFSQVSISVCIIKTYVNSSLEKIVFPHNGVEKWLHINATILISVKFQESGGAKKVSEF